jgi:hypothetical protein
VVAPDTWLKEPNQDTNRTPLRFMSEDEDEEIERLSEREQRKWNNHLPEHMSGHMQEQLIAVADPEPVALEASAPMPVQSAALEAVSHPVSFIDQPETFAMRSRFAELDEPPTYTPLPRDYATEIHSPAADPFQEPGQQLFAPAGEPEHADLDVPAFLRRGQF